MESDMLAVKESGQVGKHFSMAKLGTVMKSFLKVGVIGFGGGSALIPIIEEEVVSGKGLVDDTTYTEHTIISNITPGALPVKLGAQSGDVIAGHIGMFAGAYAVTLPGTFLTVLLLSMMSILNAGTLHKIEYASVGVSAFIIILLLHYISNVMVRSARQDFGAQAAVIMLTTALCTFGKSIRQLAVLFFGPLPHALKTPLLGVSTIDVLIVAFLIIAGTSGVFNNLKSILVAVLSAGYLVMAGKMSPVGSGAMRYIRLATLILIFVLIVTQIRSEENGDTKIKIHWERPLKQSLLFILAILVLFILSWILVGDVSFYLSNGIISSATSFGGGEAYMTVADGIFVGSNYISSADFYNKILPIANALPGPILVKVLTGIGYIKGFKLAGMAGGFVLAALGMTMGVGTSVVVCNFIYEIYRSVSQVKFFQILNLWILPVVCGLLISTMISMAYSSLEVVKGAGNGNLLAIAVFVTCFLVIMAIQKLFKLHDVLVIIISAVFSLGAIVLLQAIR